MSKNSMIRQSFVYASITLLLLVPLTQFVLQQDIAAVNHDAEIRELQRRSDNYRNRAAELAGEAETLSGAVAQLQNRQNQIQAEIDLNNAKINRLNAEIEDNEATMKRQSAALANSIATSYITGQPSALEILANSNTITEFIDHRAQQEALQNQLNSLVGEIKQLRNKLQQQRNDVAAIVEDQTFLRNEVATTQRERQELLDETQGEEERFRDMVRNNNSEIARLQEEQRQWQLELIRQSQGGSNNSNQPIGNRSIRNFSGNLGCGFNGYPWCGPMNSVIDPWRLFSRQCVSYSAWASVHRFDRCVGSFRGMGHAFQWPDTASRFMGAAVNNTPTIGAVAVWDRNPAVGDHWGHTMNVEQILPDGWILVSQYNFGWSGQFSTMEIRASSARFVHFQPFNAANPECRR